MLLNLNTDPRDHSSCALSYNEAEGWIEGVWQGYVDQTEAMQGAEAYLQHAITRPSPFLLNDNSKLQGPWFESLDWLLDVWTPQAARLGLRYVAHIVQADQHHDIFTERLLRTGTLPYELQLFQNGADARAWLREQVARVVTKPIN
jgi:hypothetical protein